MLAEIIDFGPTIKLVPNSGIQFVEYGFNIDTVGRLSRRFIERNATTDGSTPTYHLLPAWSDEDEDFEEHAAPHEFEYSISEKTAIAVFLEKWVPVPMLRVKAAADGTEDFDYGPTNWARVRIVADANRKPDSPISHRVIFAFDTELLDRRPNRPYAALSPDDSANEHEFKFAYRYRDVAWFLGALNESGPDGQDDSQDWMPAWLLDMFRDYKAAQRPGRPLRDEDLKPLEHYAHYLVLLEYLAQAIKPRAIRLIDTVSSDPNAKPVWVDLVLDVGNSRTCGILIESHPNDDNSDLNNSLVLALRDLSEPENVYSEPFESHVELSSANFGSYELSQRSTRSRAFFWPSPVRIGPEAARYRQAAQGNEATTGLSSPKRYLCDTRSVTQEWKFPDRDYGRTGTAPLIDRALRQHVNLKGDVLEQLAADRKRYKFRVAADDQVGATRLTYSRSSFFTFMMTEVLAHAISMINNAAVRERRKSKDSPRKLRRIILTVPPAMSVQEQRLLRSRTEGAIKLLYQLMGWHENPPPGLVEPEVKVTWDEASCVQFVYLYGEIHQKLFGSIEAFMRMKGRERPFAEPESLPAPGAVPEPSVRIASLDVGGGTTDLMITTYYREDTAIKPVQNFREGFRVAGDDILRGVVERIVLPQIEEQLRAAGDPDPRHLLNDRFGGDRPGMPIQEIHLRRQFVLRVLEPIALRMLADSEDESGITSIGPTRGFKEFFERPGQPASDAALPNKRLLDFIEEPARRRGATSFALANCSFTSKLDIVEQVVGSVLDLAIDNLSEAIHEFDCDVVLLSGRPSRLPSLVNLVVNKLAVAPDRVIPMHQYQAGNWYPFRSRDNRRIGDPKTTTVVGGMLCVLAESQLPNFTIFTDRLGLRSTAKFIGKMENDGRLLDDNIFFNNVDLDAAGQKQDQRPTFRYYTQMRLGYRQLPLERWIASPLYRLRMRPGLDTAQIKRPLTLTLERASDDFVDEDDADALIKSESMKEDFRIAEAVDANGVDVSRKIELIFNTLDNDNLYWLDTGILAIP